MNHRPIPVFPHMSGEFCMPGEQRAKANHYRGEAERVRLKAVAATDPVIRHELLGMAFQYEVLAVAAENREKEAVADSAGRRPCRPSEEVGMAIVTREIYSSANGDRWLLARDAASERVFIKHEANAPSGGQTTEYAVGAFLTGPQHPQQEALLELIGTLVPE
jgi:hypothetical protein